MQLSFNKNGGPKVSEPTTLDKLRAGQPAILNRLDLPDEFARRLMELGFLPGHVITPAKSAPGGEPRVYRVDGSEVALRRETAARLYVTLQPQTGRPVS